MCILPNLAALVQIQFHQVKHAINVRGSQFLHGQKEGVQLLGERKETAAGAYLPCLALC